MDDRLAEAIRREVRPSEELLGQGRPRQGWRLGQADLIAIPFAVVWCVIACLAGASMARKGIGPAEVIFLVFAAVAGLYLFVGRFWVEAKNRAASACAITSERMIFVRRRTVHSLRLEEIEEMRMWRRRDDRLRPAPDATAVGRRGRASRLRPEGISQVRVGGRREGGSSTSSGRPDASGGYGVRRLRPRTVPTRRGTRRCRRWLGGDRLPARDSTRAAVPASDMEWT